jgi:hypothetical protein
MSAIFATLSRKYGGLMMVQAGACEGFFEVPGNPPQMTSYCEYRSMGSSASSIGAAATVHPDSLIADGGSHIAARQIDARRCSLHFEQLYGVTTRCVTVAF